MNLLFISPYLPSETSGHTGAQLIFRNVMPLAKNHVVTIASFIDKNETEMIHPLIDRGIHLHTIDYPRNPSSVSGKVASGIRNIGPVASYLKGEEPFSVFAYDIDLYKDNPEYYYDIDKLFNSFITREPLEVYNMLYNQLINENCDEGEQVNIFNNLFLPSYNHKGPYDIAEIIQLCGVKK